MRTQSISDVLRTTRTLMKGHLASFIVGRDWLIHVQVTSAANERVSESQTLLPKTIFSGYEPQKGILRVVLIVLLYFSKHTVYQ